MNQFVMKTNDGVGTSLSVFSYPYRTFSSNAYLKRRKRESRNCRGNVNLHLSLLSNAASLIVSITNCLLRRNIQTIVNVPHDRRDLLDYIKVIS